ncbi:MAG: class I SAM-dependent methyltransferase [Candidatus Omnitrophota bacterium]|nr:class I SAM-dependent methyltransferase [Candidatus Omnitrophota bacterium]
MISIVAESLEQYAASHTGEVSEVLKALEQETYAKTDLPQMLVGHVESRLLSFLVKVSGARRILEIGTFTGYSALAMAEALPEGGEVVTCDTNETTVEIARRFWSKSLHGKKITFKLGPALETLAVLEGPFDMVFIDADKENYTRYWEACLPKLPQGGLIVADNVLWSGRVLSPKESSDKAIVAFNKHAKADLRTEVVMLTVRDGILLARKK